MAKKAESWDSPENEVQSNWIKWNVPLEDKIIGTLISKRQIKSQMAGKEGELVWVYEVKADAGSFHALDEKKKLIEEPIEINAGEVWSVGGKAGIDAQMRNVKVGQKVGFKFIDEQPAKTKGYNPSKNIKVYTPKNDDGSFQMDEEVLEAQGSLEGEFNK